jgi:hypothetical protein
LVQFVPLPPQCVFTNPTVVTPFNFAASETRVGWTVGAGVEGHSGTIGRSSLNMISSISALAQNDLPKFLRFDHRRDGRTSTGAASACNLGYIRRWGHFLVAEASDRGT